MERNFVRLAWQEREATKHVESFGVGFWIRVQFSAPPPFLNRRFEICDFRTSLNRKHLDRNFPIGIFDSGVGGLTVYRALHERLPNERFVYLGDTARVPYGTKSLATVERYAVENSKFLEARGIKLLVVACNTASALAVPAIRRAVHVPVIGVIEPGARAAVEVAQRAKTSDSDTTNIGVIATE